jgi:hypothetical protein
MNLRAPTKFAKWRKQYYERRKRHFIEDSNQYVTCRQFKFWRRSAMIAFLLLLLGALGNTAIDRERADTGRQVLVDSSRVVVIDGCNRDFRTIEKLRAVFQRSIIALGEQLKAGDITQERYDNAIKFYNGELRLLKLPDCRRARNIITDNPFRDVPPPPVPLYPGSPLATPPPQAPGG